MQRILFVCLGNICRSPTAEAVLRQMAGAAGVAVEVDSAGTGGWHAGEPPHPPAVAAARRHGYDMAALRARQVTGADFTRFDRIYAMDRRNLADLQALSRGLGTAPELFLAQVRAQVLAQTPGPGTDEVPDPWYSGEFDLVLRLIEAGCRGVLAGLR